MRMLKWFVHHVLQLKIVAHFRWTSFSAFLKIWILLGYIASYWLWKSWMWDFLLFFFFYTFIQFHTHHHLPICIKSLIWTFPFSFHSTSLHTCANVEGLNIPTSAIKGTYLVLVTQCPTSLCRCHTVLRHSLNVIFYNNNVTFVIWRGSICCNSDTFSSKFLHISNLHHLVNFCVVHCVYFFCYFCISERRLYFNSMLEYVVEFVTKTRGKNYKIH